MRRGGDAGLRPPLPEKQTRLLYSNADSPTIQNVASREENRGSVFRLKTNGHAGTSSGKIGQETWWTELLQRWNLSPHQSHQHGCGKRTKSVLGLS